MEHDIQSGNPRKLTGVSRCLMVAAAMFLSAAGVYGQAVQSCTASGVAVNLHPEGLTERLGDITLTCQGGTPGAIANVTLFVGLQNATPTNALNSNGTYGISASVNGAATGASILINGQAVVVQGVIYTVPALGIQTVLTISGIRAAIGNTPGIQAVYANVGGTGLNVTSTTPVALGVPNVSGSLLTSYLGSGIPCNGSVFPPVITPALPDFISAGTTFSTLRVTEGYAAAFTPLDSTVKNGTRIVVSLSGYPAGARVFVPDVIVGSSGGPTSAGGFGTFPGVGYYTPGPGQLLLTRVSQADKNGVDGTNVLPVAPGFANAFSSMSEITLVAGSATVTYEVLDANPNVRESAQIIAFVVAPPTSCATIAQPAITAKLGPISTDATSNIDAPLPRYVSAVAASDCSVLGDCSASYFPNLAVDTTPITFNGLAYGAVQLRSLAIGNTGQGSISYSIGITYTGGSSTNWLKVTPTSGTNSTTVNIQADPSALVPGTYTANITVNAGTYGSQTIPVTFVVGSPGVTIQSIVSAATFVQGGPVTAGSIASLFGLNLSGRNVVVTFDGLPAQIFGVYNTAGSTTALPQYQINLLVPVGLGSKTTAQVVATVDGAPSNSFTVSLVQNSPGVFNPGILNQNFTVNTAASPAKTGTIISAYMTGLSVPITGQVTVKIGTLDFLIPQYAGVAPTLSGVQQINVFIPPSVTFTGNSAPLVVCIPSLDPTQRVCSPSVPLYLTQ